MNAAAMVRVREVSDLVTKGTTPTSLGRRFTSRGVKFLKVETFAADGSFIAGREAFIDDSTHHLLRRSQLAQGDILFSIAGALGRSTVVEQAWLPANTNQAFAIIRPSTRRRPIHPRYLLWQLRSPAIARRIAEINVQAAQANLSLEQVRDFEIPFVSIPEQGAIAAALDDVDDLIVTLERLIAKKQAIKQGMMQQLLTGRTRLPGYTEDWPSVTLGGSGVVAGGGVDKTSNPTEASVLLLNYMDVYRTEFIDHRSVTQVVTAASPKIAKCSIRAGDVFFTPTSETPDDIARSAVADDDLPGVVYSYHLVRWRPGPGWDRSYLAYAFSTEAFRSQASTLAAGSGTRYVVSMPGFRSLVVPRPPVDEQRAIGEALRDVSSGINVLFRRLAKVRAIKTGMMQQLLTGRTRLHVEAAS